MKEIWSADVAYTLGLLSGCPTGVWGGHQDMGRYADGVSSGDEKLAETA
jgi:hypothetical protein